MIPTIRSLITSAEAAFGLEEGDITSSHRGGHITQARDWVCYEARQSGKSQMQIARVLGILPGSVWFCVQREEKRRAAHVEA